MGLDDLVDDHEESAEEDKAEELADELGIEDKEELERLDGRISRVYEHMILLDAQVERLSNDMKQMKKLLGELIRKEQEEQMEEKNTDDDDQEEGSWLDYE